MIIMTDEVEEIKDFILEIIRSDEGITIEDLMSLVMVAFTCPGKQNTILAIMRSMQELDNV